MSDWRTFNWRSGAIPRSSRIQLFEPGRDPELGLPLETPAASGGAYTLIAQAGAYIYAGQSGAIARSRLLTANSGSYAYTGQSATLLRNRALGAAAGSYVYVGQDAELDYAPAPAAPAASRNAMLASVGSMMNR